MPSYALNPLILPEGAAERRSHIVPEKYRLEGYDATYDFRTIAYDAIWMEAQKAVLLICPKLLSLEPLLKLSHITLSGAEAKGLRINRYRRHDEVWIRCSARPEALTLSKDMLKLNTKISDQAHGFAGKNVLMTKSKDNALPWVSDWLRHHQMQQGANAALIFDNGSRDYPLADLQHCMDDVEGLEHAAAVASDFPFGSWKATKLLHRSMFYQAGMLALARHRFLHNARAVLPIDIDELVCGANVFDAAYAARLGYVTIPGVWRYSRLPDDQMPRHADHIWRKEPDAVSKEKYCLAPGRAFTDTVWDIHGIRRYAFNKLAMMKNARFLHCEHISNGWKRKRNAEQGTELMRDPQSEQDLAHLNQ